MPPRPSLSPHALPEPTYPYNPMTLPEPTHPYAPP